MKVLISNLRLHGQSGTETYVRDVAVELMRQGHTPFVYSPHLGPMAEQLRSASVCVTDDLSKIRVQPDVIHGHHAMETLAALLHFPGTPGIFVCHDASAWHDTPPDFPRILRYLAVDEACRDRMVLSGGINEERVQILQNAVALDWFPIRSPLPVRPGRALVFSNYVEREQAAIVRKAVEKHGMQLELLGARLGGASECPEKHLQKADLVFAKGRCVWEAIATGCAAIALDAQGMGEIVTTSNFEHQRRNNFGRRLLQQPITVESICQQIERYDSSDAGSVTKRLRKEDCLSLRVNELCLLYESVIHEHRSASVSCVEELQAVSAAIQWWSRSRQAQNIEYQPESPSEPSFTKWASDRYRQWRSKWSW